MSFVYARRARREDEQVEMDRERGESSEAGEGVRDHGAVSCSASEYIGDGT